MVLALPLAFVNECASLQVILLGLWHHNEQYIMSNNNGMVFVLTETVVVSKGQGVDADEEIATALVANVLPPLNKVWDCDRINTVVGPNGKFTWTCHDCPSEK